MNIRRIASIADIVLGVWLLLTCLLWAQFPLQVVNAIVVGCAAIILGGISLRGQDWCRWVVAGFAIWLFVSLWILPRGSAAIVAHHLVIATLLFGFSVLPMGRGSAAGEYPL
jgi:hypothetical protein